LLEFVADGTWSKWLHLGWSAMGGIVAARLAKSGFRGATTVLEGRFGLYAAFAGEGAALDRITADLGTRWEGDLAAPKYYPCAHVTQPYIDMALTLATGNDLKPAQIAKVTCVVADWAVPIVCEPSTDKKKPRTSMQAIASLPWFVATALTDRVVGLDTIGDEFRARADLQDLAQRIDYRVDPALGRSFDGGLEITLADGRTLRVAGGMGGLDPAKLDAKFRGLAARGLSGQDVEALARCLDGPGAGKKTGIAGAFRKAGSRS
jgi:2-methylcitrate dehydratase PrpD